MGKALALRREDWGSDTYVKGQAQQHAYTAPVSRACWLAALASQVQWDRLPVGTVRQSNRGHLPPTLTSTYESAHTTHIELKIGGLVTPHIRNLGIQ